MSRLTSQLSSSIAALTKIITYREHAKKLHTDMSCINLIAAKLKVTNALHTLKSDLQLLHWR